MVLKPVIQGMVFVLMNAFEFFYIEKNFSFSLKSLNKNFKVIF